MTTRQSFVRGDFCDWSFLPARFSVLFWFAVGSLQNWGLSRVPHQSNTWLSGETYEQPVNSIGMRKFLLKSIPCVNMILPYIGSSCLLHVVYCKLQRETTTLDHSYCSWRKSSHQLGTGTLVATGWGSVGREEKLVSNSNLI